MTDGIVVKINVPIKLQSSVFRPTSGIAISCIAPNVLGVGYTGRSWSNLDESAVFALGIGCGPALQDGIAAF